MHDPTDPVGRLLLTVLAMVAEFEAAALINARTREGMAVARAAGKLRGRKPKLTPAREALMVDLHRTGQKNPCDLADLFGVGRSTVYRALDRAGAAGPDATLPHSGVRTAPLTAASHMLQRGGGLPRAWSQPILREAFDHLKNVPADRGPTNDGY